MTRHQTEVIGAPASGTVHVRYRLEQPAPVGLRVYDLLGRLVHERDLGTSPAPTSSRGVAIHSRQGRTSST